MKKYQVIVSNVGMVYDGEDHVDAVREYLECLELSASNYGRFGSECVTLFCDGEVLNEYRPANYDD